MGMQLTDEDLLPSERVLAHKLANLWIKPSQHGLSQFAFNKFLGNNEALGGSAYLTNYRIIFKSHGINRLVGMRSLFLPNIVQIRKGWIGIKVESEAQSFSFVMWFNGRFVSTAQAAKDELGPQEVEHLKQLLLDHPNRIGGLQKHATFESINQVLSGVVTVASVLEKLASPDQGLFIELLTLFAKEKKAA